MILYITSNASYLPQPYLSRTLVHHLTWYSDCINWKQVHHMHNAHYSTIIIDAFKIGFYYAVHVGTECLNYSNLCEHGRWEQAWECQPHYVEAKDNSTTESHRTGINLFVGSISSRNETNDTIFKSQTWENGNQHDWLSFFVIPLPRNQTTKKKEEKAKCENHTHFKYQ